MVEIFLWPGTKICEMLNISREADEAGLARSMFNTLVYLAVGLIGLWIYAAQVL